MRKNTEEQNQESIIKKSNKPGLAQAYFLPQMSTQNSDTEIYKIVPMPQKKT